MLIRRYCYEKERKLFGCVVAFGLFALSSLSFSASAITAGPYYDTITTSYITYNVKHRTMVKSNSYINKNLDGYNMIAKAAASDYKYISTYAALGNGNKSSSVFNGYNGIHNKPSTGPTPAAQMIVGASADNYSTGGSVISLITASTSSNYYAEVSSSLSYCPVALTSYGSIEYRYPNANIYEYVAVTNY